ncbi:hypothetical protein [Streptomyces sp. NRRL S-475]|uniref:hypothetical protein n=1 Tax=Streptomyces sp. NRRL S-475 TaxID=1463910 RepID=UPI0004BD0F99|nr:hypothetical protein [Streptomyces sp. NRRL S-475]
MAYYVVVDGKRNAQGEADTFVVRASGRRIAAATAPLADRKNAIVLKLEDGRHLPNGVILSSLVDHEPEPVAEPLDLPETVSLG